MTPARRHKVEEIVAILREMDRLTEEQGMSVSAAAQTLGITDQTFYRWRARYGSLPEDEAKRLQVLDEENARLKRLIAEQSQDISMLQDLTQGEIPSGARRREAVDYLVQRYRISERRACRLVGQHRSTQRYGVSGRSVDQLPVGHAAEVAETGENGYGLEGREPNTADWLGQGWRGGSKEAGRSWQHEEHGTPEPEPVVGTGEPHRRAGGGSGIPAFLDERIPCLGRLRAGLVHDLLWLARESEMARLLGTRAVVERLEDLASPPRRLVRLVRGHSEGAAG